MKPQAKSFQSRYSKATGHSPAMAARRALLKRIQRQELRKLQMLLPSCSSGYKTRSEPDACQVIDQTIRYIDQLHATILARVRSGALPSDVLNQLNLGSFTGYSLNTQSVSSRVPAQTTEQATSLPKLCSFEYQ